MTFLIRTANGQLPVGDNFFGARPWHYDVMRWNRSITIACDWTQGRPTRGAYDWHLDEGLLNGHITLAEMYINAIQAAQQGQTVEEYYNAEAQEVVADVETARQEAQKTALSWWKWILIGGFAIAGVVVFLKWGLPPIMKKIKERGPRGKRR